MTESPDSSSQTAPREIVVASGNLEMGHIEAWTNIIASYAERHPEHRVIILYEGEAVHNVISLYKKGGLNPHGFEMAVAAPDANWKDVPKLYRYLVEGAGPGFRKFLQPEVHRVLKLF